MTLIGSALAELIKKIYKQSGVKTDFNYPVHEFPYTTSANKYRSFLQGLLSKKTVIEMSERIVENAFVFINLDTQIPGKILEIGCCRSTVALELASLGYKVTAVDLKNYKYKHPNLKFIQGDLRFLNLPKNYFDAATAISTIEHTGLGAYKETASSKGDMEMMDIIYKVLKPKGKLIITVPYGVNETNEHERVYDNERLKQLLHKFKIVKIIFFKGIGRKYWIPVESHDLMKVSSTKNGFTQGVACLVVTKK